MINSKEFVTEEKDTFSLSVRAFLPKIARIPVFEEGKTSISVKVGDFVREGQLLAQSNSVVVRSSVPGEVVSIERAYYANGKPGLVVCVKTGGKFTYLARPLKIDDDWQNLSADEIAQKVRKAGIANTFSSFEPIFSQIEKGKGKVLAVRLFDDDPTRSVESFICEKYFENVYLGAKILARACASSAIVFVYDKSSSQERKIFRENGENPDDFEIPIFFVALNSKTYPCGSKNEIVQAIKILSKSVFKKNEEVAKSLSSISKKDIFVDSPCVLAVFEAICKNLPVLSRFVQVGGNALFSSAILRVKIGTTIQELAAMSGGFRGEVGRVLINGSILGKACPSLDVSVSKFVKSVTFFSEQRQESRIYREVSCIRCGSCRKVCPVHIWPGNVYRVFRNVQIKGFDVNDDEKAVLLTAQACEGCSLCSAVCPSRLPLAQTIALAASHWGEEDGQE